MIFTFIGLIRCLQTQLGFFQRALTFADAFDIQDGLDFRLPNCILKPGIGLCQQERVA